MTAVVIFSGNNDRAVTSFCRYATARAIPFYIIANGQDDCIYNTQYAENVFAERRNNIFTRDDIISVLTKLKAAVSCNKFVILPSNEYLNRFLLAHKLELEMNKVYTGLCEESVYAMISDKYSFGTICKENGINVPQGYSAQPSMFPFVIKPKSYAKAGAVLDRPCIAYTENDSAVYLKDKNHEDYYYQEFIGGQSIYLLFYIFRNGNYSVFSQENFAQQPNGRSMILCQSAEHHKNVISTTFARLFNRLGFFGLVMIEVKKFNDIFYMIEANPRLWGPSQLILDSGMDLFDCFAFENGLISEMPECNYMPGTWYFWSGGLHDYLSSTIGITYYQNGRHLLEQNKIDIEKQDIYNRNDTIKIYQKESLLSD